MRTYRFNFLLLAFLAVLSQYHSMAQAIQPGQQVNSILLPNGWRLSPAGKHIGLGDLPLNMVISHSNKWVAVTNNGQSDQCIELIDIQQKKILDSVSIPASWYGLKFSGDDRYLFVSGGNHNVIYRYAIISHKSGKISLQVKDTISLGEKWPNPISPAGIELDEDLKLLYVVTKENNSLYVVDLKTKKTVVQTKLGEPAYTCVLSLDRKELYISLWGGKKLMVFDTRKKTISDSIGVGENPNELILSKNGRYVYIANAGDNSVSVIDIPKRKVLETLNAALFPDAPTGSATNGLALSTDQKKLYVANADNNCLAVFDISFPGFSRSLGFIPTGWYPTSVRVSGKTILVCNGKGYQSMANPKGPNPLKKEEEVIYQKGDTLKQVPVQYIGGLFKGTLSFIPEPGKEQLAAYSLAVYKNTPYNKQKDSVSNGVAGNPIPRKVGDSSPIKHVFYIIKENRTYDQVLGDIEKGNGDTSLVLFGRKVTPNQHKLAEEFVLFDNFYVDGEVSADGHNWSMAANANDYLEKTWPSDYGGRGGKYDAEGNREVSNPDRGFIWDYCKRAGISYRTYGEFADDYKANIPVLKDHFCPYYTSWDESVRDTTRFFQWKREFDSLLLANAVPRLSTLRFINDHTQGLSVGKPTPVAHVADNDLAVGMFIEYLSKSPIWNQSVVFILEDDAQNGPDHVDAHRSTAYLAGGYVKRGFVDHTMYSTSSVLRTIELILGLPPMSQYDASAEPMWRSFMNAPEPKGFTALPASVDITERNKAVNAWSRMSEKFDFSKEDRAPDLLFNMVIWKSVKGIESVMPAPRRSAFIMSDID